MIPLYGFVHGDTLGLVILADPDETCRVLASRLQSAASVRVPPCASIRVLCEGREAPLDAKLASFSVRPLARIDLIPGEGEP